ncbi:MAG: hypothetical protein PF570_00235 [Candidatus Cloacimonetes bacterium]|jgi:hypothetical protein|nr:hypothetical protein [Candidatus Cloacimonadota bacterium]
MKKWIILYFLFIVVIASAEDFNDTIFIQFHQALDSLIHIKYQVTPATFKFKNKTYAGYEIVFETKWSLLDKDTDPMSMFRPLKRNYWYASGWRADIRFCADGPGSTFYLIRNGEFFCTIRWEFVSYIDDNGEYVTGDELSGRIQCGTEIIEK